MSNPEPNAPLLDLSDLKFQPAWVNESSDHSRYFGAAEQGDRPRRDDRGDRRGPRPPRDGGGFGGGGQGRGTGNRPQQRDSRPPRPGGAPAAPATGERRSFPPRDARGGDRRDQRGPGGGQGFRPREERRPPPVAVKIDFLPDPNVLNALAQQIKNSHMTFPLFGLSRKFLEKPEYHAIRVTAVEKDGQPAPTLYRIGDDGPILLDKRAAERIAFEREKATLFEEKTELGELPKGNFTNVARCRLDGTLLGPTNHHAYQTSLRALYESRYSRRMPFEQFRREIETVSDPAEVEKWKEQSRATTTLTVVGTEPPVVLNSVADARRWFEENRLANLIQSGPSFVMKGVVARQGADPALGRAIGGAWDEESRHPLNLVQVVRSGLQKAGLQIFKHRKKFVYVSGVRPMAFRAEAGSAISPTVQQILDLIGASPGISRKALAERILGPAPAEKAPEAAPAEAAASATSEPTEAPTTPPEGETPAAPAPAAEAAEAPAAPAAAPAVTMEDPYARAKSLLIADLRWLTAAGHVIALHDGTYDLPPSPQAKPAPSAAPTGKAKVATEAADAAPAAELTAAEVAAATEEAAQEAAAEEAAEARQTAAAADETVAESPVAEAAAEPAKAEETQPATEPKKDEGKPADSAVPGWAD